MLEVFLSGGFLMFPILLCSTVALAIICERLWTLRKDNVVPQDVLPTLLHNLQNKQINKRYLKQVSEQTSLGSVLAKGITNLAQGHEVMILRMSEQGRHVIHDLERYLNALGTIAAITPLIGLLGTVMGMIQVFAAISMSGPSDSEVLAGGISQALLTTAFGLSVAIPSLMFHRHFHRKIDEIAVILEQEASKLVEFYKEMQFKMKQETTVSEAA